MSDQEIADAGDLKHWRTELPNIIDDLGLDPFGRTLYAHYKKVCGANGKPCEEGVRKTAEKTGMSTAKVSLIRRKLAEKGLITEHIQDKQADQIKPQVHVTIVDIWEINFLYYSFKEGRPNIAGWAISQVREWIDSVYQINADNQRLPPKRERLPDKRKEAGERLPRKQKKEPTTQKEHEKHHGASAQDDAPPANIFLNQTPARRILKAKFEASVSRPNGHGAPRQFPTADVAAKFDAAAARLNGGLAAAIDAALVGGCNSIIRIVHYIAKYEVNGKDKPHARSGLDETAQRISQALKARRGGSGSGAPADLPVLPGGDFADDP